MSLILASASPRRRDLLYQVGCRCRVVPSEAAEMVAHGAVSPAALAVNNALAKARRVAARAAANDVVIGADTVVVLDDTILGKPVDDADAVRMLTSLAGREHSVVTGVAVIKGRLELTDHVVTRVLFRPLSRQEIVRYVATGEPRDKAGAYAIQGRGALLVEAITGSYSNVVGLPLTQTAALLAQVGVHLL